MDKFLHPTYPLRCINTGPSECGKFYFVTILFSEIVQGFEIIYI